MMLLFEFSLVGFISGTVGGLIVLLIYLNVKRKAQ